jgi:MOSC domain-containing protein YiiM
MAIDTTERQSSIKTLTSTLPRIGQVVWLGVRPGHREPMRAVDQVTAERTKGLIGDRFRGRSTGKRQVTLIQAEHLAAIASYLGREQIDPELLRRNIVVKELNLLALKNNLFHVGDALLEMTGLCHPCSRMEEVLGPGGYNAMRGHGGITARVLRSGMIRRLDSVRVIQDSGVPDESK